MHELFIGSAIQGEVSPQVLAEIFVDACYTTLRPFCKDKAKLVQAMEGAFNPKVFYVAFWEGYPVGIASCRGKRSWVIRPDLASFRRHMGEPKGTMLYWMFRREYSEGLPSSPDGVGHIDCIATRGDFCNRGVATALIEHIRHSLPYQSVVLEVPDNNKKALRLYAKLGFVETHRVKEKFPILRGFRLRIFLQAPMLEAGGRTSGLQREPVVLP